MRLSAKSEYGLLAMIDLAQSADSSPTSAREISTRQEIPVKFLEQLLVALRRAGLVQGVRGARGGFILSRDARDISVLDVVEALEGPLTTTVCDAERASVCGKSGMCAASGVWNEATKALKDVFRNRSVADLARDQIAIDDSKVVVAHEREGQA
mgnify:CR=1 FL=1